MGGHHLRVLRSLEGVTATSVDPDPERGADHLTLEEALPADFACVAVPVAQLAATASAALAAGLHVLVEKPTASDVEQAGALAETAERAGLCLGVGHVERFNPAVVALRDRLREGTIGTIVQMHARRLSPFPGRASMQGCAVDLATHDIDVMRYITGSEVARVSAETAAPLGSAHEDLLCATLRFDSGATGVLESNWVTPTKVRELTVTGEHGMFVVDYLRQDLSLYEHPTRANEWDALAGMRGGGEGDMTRYALDRREPLRVQWERFLAAMADNTAPPVTAADGVAALSVARAIQRAGGEHRAIVPSYREAVTV